MLISNTLTVAPNTSLTGYTLPDIVGSPAKFLISVSSIDGIHRAFEILTIKTGVDIFHSVYGVVGDYVNMSVDVITGTSGIEVVIMNNHTGDIDVTLTPLVGGQSITAFI